jgi:predicted TIM-barrel fold metal-dependent hydrolase
MIIDAHTHLFPPGIAEDHEPYRARDPWFHETFASPKIRFATPASLIDEMDDAGVDHAIVVGWPWRDSGLCAEHNAYLAEVARDSAGRISWMAIANPVDLAASNLVQDAKALGAVAIGEVNADAQEFDWREPSRFSDFAETCLHLELPVMVHASEPTGHIYPGKGTATPDRIVALAQAFPELRIVAAHWGGGLPFYELMPEVRESLRNVSYDTAASTYLYSFDIFDSVTRVVGPERVIFGSDYPILGIKRFIERIRQTELDESALTQILAGSAARVYGIGYDR